MSKNLLFYILGWDDGDWTRMWPITLSTAYKAEEIHPNIYLVRPERIERSLLTEYASKTYGSTYSPKDAYQFFDFLFHHVKDLNQL